MPTKKAGLVLSKLGAVTFLASLLVDYVGAGDRKLGASQILGMEIGAVILLVGIFLPYLHPDSQASIGAGIRTSLQRLFNLSVRAWVIAGFFDRYFSFSPCS